MNTWLSWSSGKDSAWALYQLTQMPEINVTGLVVSINQKHGRVAMHGTHNSLLNEQVKRLGIPIYPVYLPDNCSDATYQQLMQLLIQKAKSQDVKYMAFGDLFLEEIRTYREKQLAHTGITPIFPLWQQPTDQLAMAMIQSGIKAVISCVDTKQIPANFVGRQFNTSLLHDLPKGVDPCGENGEFHTFIYDTPMFETPIDIMMGKTHQSDQFLFIDIQLAIMKKSYTQSAESF